MTAAAKKLSGGCLCGAVRFTAVPKKAEMDACHCGMCQRWSGGVFMAVSCGEVAVEDESELGTYPSSEWAMRQFCKRCGSSLFWRLREGGDHVAVSFQSFDDKNSFIFLEEIFIDAKPALYDFAGERPRLTGAEVLARFEAQQEGRS
ncbi:GFA family protein [Bosea beijingensis]|uniref:GFA family protein n=1 Tax=Bosea beijingensis TaxID=3068632 RepID=UPI002741A3B1|nr:GFA family protein [Bosea sp. REN20]